MKLRKLFLAVIAGAALLTACDKKEVDLGPAKLAVNPTDVSFEAEVSSQDISLVATRDWAVTSLPDWVALSKETGSASSDAQKLSISVTENKGYNRSATIVFSIGFARQAVTINQVGPDGEIDNGDGTKEKPFTVAGAIAYVKELGADVESPKKVFVKGIVSTVETTYEASGTYGNATFNIVDEEGSSEVFKVYQTYYLGNVKWTKGDNNPDIKEKDEVIIYGKIYNYKGNTPETVSKGASFVYSLNGVNRGGDDSSSSEDETPDETLAPASDTNIAGLVAKIAKTSTSSQKSAYSGITLAGATVTYVNGGNVYLEDNSGAVLLYMSNSGFVAGDVISGPVSGEGYYYNGLPEIVSLGDAYTKTPGTAPVPTEMTIERLLSTYTSQLSRYLIIKNVTVTEGMASRKAVIAQGEKTVNVYAALKEGLTLEKDASGDIIVFPTLYNATKQVSFWDNSHFTGNGGVTPPGPVAHDGLTPETAFTASEANAWIMANINGNSNTGDTKYYVKGKIQRFYQKDNADQNFTNNSYHQASFFITDDGTENKEKEFEAFQIDYLNDATFDPSKDTDVKVGDEVVVYGPLAKYNTTAETAGKGAAYLYSVNAGGEVPPTPGPGGDATVIKLNNESTWTAGTDGTYGAGFEMTASNGVKVGVYKHKSSNAIVAPDQYSVRVYKSAVIVLTAPEGKNITSLSFKANGASSGQYCVDLTFLEGGTGVLTADNTALTIGSFSGSANKIVLQAAAAQARLVEANITLSGEGGDTPGGDTPGGDTPAKPVNEGTLESPFTVADALIAAKDADLTGKEYYVKAVVGKDIAIKNGVASFELMDGTTDGKLTVVKAKSFKGAAFDGSEPLDWLDEVILKGTVTEYSTLPALTEGELVKWNGKTMFKAAFTTIAQLNALATTTPTEYTGTLENAVVSFVPDTKNAVIKDATGSVFYFKNGHGLKQGQTFSGDVTVKLVLYNNASEITAIDATFTGEEAVVEPESVSLSALAADFAKYQNAYVKVKDLEVVSVSGKNINVKNGNDTYVVYSNAGNATVEVGKTITATGTICQYSNKAQIKAWTMDAVEVQTQPTAKYVKVTSAPTDWSGTFLLVSDTDKKAFNAFSGTIGTGADVTISEGVIESDATVDTYQIVIAKATVTDGAYTIKFGTKFFSWTSGNSLGNADAESVNANWNITYDTASKSVYIVNAADAARKIRWNHSSPRFACYTSAQTDVQLYKYSE